jgi:N-acetylneuraminic acid mutarotase
MCAAAFLTFSAVASAQVATPTWTNTGSLNTARSYYTTTLLANGKVLVAGGSSSTGLLSTAELYDPSTGTWSFTGSLNFPRIFHTATLLQNGKVLVAGGWG